MLVLTRKKSQTIQIGDEITIKVIRTGASTVKIGIEAPADVRILRGELCGDEKPTEHVLEWQPKDARRMEMGVANSEPSSQSHIASRA